MKAIVTVIGKDQVGIIAAVCTLLSEKNVNVLDISQTILQEFFTMTMLVDVHGHRALCPAPRGPVRPRPGEGAGHPGPTGGHFRRHAPDLSAVGRTCRGAWSGTSVANQESRSESVVK